ncbi:MAG: recombination protein F [Candidatus Bathyarchaeota archaeon BA2]|nr:MAG: recombination protein F [Candidatus Bathyarchaeota archaeon BA2]
MIKSLEIENFKSIKYLKLDCKRINLFIGEPNTGKSNILEAIGLLSHVPHYGPLRGIRRFVRFENMRDLFYDRALENKVNISFDGNALETTFKDGLFYGNYFKGKEPSVQLFNYNYEGSGGVSLLHPDLVQFKFYRFAVMENFPNQQSDFLRPPNGDNLLAVILTRKDLRALTKQIFDRFGLALVFEPQEGRIRVQKQLEDIIIAFPYSLASETLQRLFFFLTAIHSNKNSILAFEEPEAHAFPHYTKYLAEVIALDKNENQYFISTHNPYFLLSVLEKTPKNEIAIFNTHLENYQTKVKALTEDEMKEVLEKGIDLFFDIERFLG